MRSRAWSRPFGTLLLSCAAFLCCLPTANPPPSASQEAQQPAVGASLLPETKGPGPAAGGGA